MAKKLLYILLASSICRLSATDNTALLDKIAQKVAALERRMTVVEKQLATKKADCPASCQCGPGCACKPCKC